MDQKIATGYVRSHPPIPVRKKHSKSTVRVLTLRFYEKMFGNERFKGLFMGESDENTLLYLKFLLRYKIGILFLVYFTRETIMEYLLSV